MSEKRKGTPEFVYAPSRQEAQRLLDESYLQKFVALPFNEGFAAVLTELEAERSRVRDLEAALRAAASAAGHPDAAEGCRLVIRIAKDSGVSADPDGRGLAGVRSASSEGAGTVGSGPLPAAPSKAEGIERHEHGASLERWLSRLWSIGGHRQSDEPR